MIIRALNIVMMKICARIRHTMQRIFLKVAPAGKEIMENLYGKLWGFQNKNKTYLMSTTKSFTGNILKSCTSSRVSLHGTGGSYEKAVKNFPR